MANFTTTEIWPFSALEKEYVNQYVTIFSNRQSITCTGKKSGKIYLIDQRNRRSLGPFYDIALNREDVSQFQKFRNFKLPRGVD